MSNECNFSLSGNHSELENTEMIVEKPSYQEKLKFVTHYGLRIALGRFFFVNYFKLTFTLNTERYILMINDLVFGM